MPPTSRIPSALQPYLTLHQKGCLLLFTSILGASTNWLLCRHLCAALSDRNGRPQQQDEDTASQTPDEDVSVILVSFLRDWEFWKGEARRSGGLDLPKLAQEKRFVFVDGLTGMYTPTSYPASTTSNIPSTRSMPSPSSTSSPRTLPHRTPPATATTIPSQAQTQTQPNKPPSTPGTFTIPRATLQDFESTISKAIDHLQLRRILLLIDNPDVLLATAATPQSKDITPPSLNASILSLRRRVHTTVVTLAVDTLSSLSAFSWQAGVAPGHSLTPLEANHAAFVVGLAHAAAYVLSLRLLDSGFAADVSGVLRITKGPVDVDVDSTEEGEKDDGGRGEKELLYHIGNDGGAKVFQRGSGTEHG